MSTETEVQIHLSAEDRASAIIQKVRREVEALTKSLRAVNAIKAPNVKAALGATGSARGAAADFAQDQRNAAATLRQRFAFESRMARQQASEARAAERERQAGAAAAVQDIRTRMRFASAMHRQRLAEERQLVREAAAGQRARERQDRQAARDTAQEARAADRRQAGARRDLHQAGTRAGTAVHETMSGARTIGVYSAVGAGIVAQIARTGLKARAATDSAEAGLRMFGGQSREQVEAARSGWLNRSAIDNAFRPAEAIKAFTETLKAGIPDVVAPAVTKSIMGAATGLDLNVADTTKLVGRLSTLTQDPKRFRPEAIDEMLNGIAVVAKVTAADSKELVSSLRRGAGVLGSSKMSVADLTAFTGVGISAGMQEGKAGTFMDFLVNDLVNAKNSRGQRRDDLSKAFGILGLGGTAAVSQKAAQDPATLLMRIFEKMHGMSPDRAGQVASLLGMREWRGEALMMAKAAPILRQTLDSVRDPKNSKHLEQARNERLGTLAGLNDQIRATFDLAWEAVGGGIEDIVREVGAFFLDLGRNLKLDVIKAHVRTLLDGFVDGLGFTNVREMLEKFFGKPGEMDFSHLNSFFEFARGFGQGVRDVVDSITKVARMIAGQDANAATLGRLAANIMGFSVALVTIAPVISVIAGLATALGALSLAALGVGKALKGLGLLGGVGAAGASAGASGASKLAALGGWSVVGASVAAGFVEYLATKGGNAVSTALGGGEDGVGATILKSLGLAAGPGGASVLFGAGKLLEMLGIKGTADPRGSHTGNGVADPETTGSIGGLRQPSSFRPVDGDWRTLIQPASFRTGSADRDSDRRDGSYRDGRMHRSGFGSSEGTAWSVAQSLERLARAFPGGASIGRNVFTTPAAVSSFRRSAQIDGFGYSPSISSSGGIGYGAGLGIEPGRQVPSWYKQGSGLGGARIGSAGRAGMGASGAGPSDNSPIAPVKGKTFGEVGPRLLADLQKDFGLSKTQAAAIVGNLGHESGGFTAFQEKNPLGGGRGGWGYAQWTGSRRRQFEAWAQARGLDPKSYEANYGFLRHELQTSEKAGIAAVRRHDTLEGGTVAFERSFERAGIKHDASRLKWARRAAGLPDVAAGVEGPKAAAVDGANRNAWGGSDPMKPDAKALAQGSVRPSPEDLARANVPTPPRRPVELGGRPPGLDKGGTGFRPGGGAGGNTYVSHVTVNGANRPNAELAGDVQRHVSAGWNMRAHDLEPELT